MFQLENGEEKTDCELLCLLFDWTDLCRKCLGRSVEVRKVESQISACISQNTPPVWSSCLSVSLECEATGREEVRDLLPLISRVIIPGNDVSL